MILGIWWYPIIDYVVWVRTLAVLQTKSFNTSNAAIGSSQQRLPLASMDNQPTRVESETVLKTESEEKPMSITMSGTIYKKFEYGYFVTVKIGAETLNGILYHSVSPSNPDSNSVTMTMNADTIIPSIGSQQNQESIRRKGKRKRDPNHPKPNRSAYNFYFADEHSRLKLKFPQREREFSKMIGESWGKLSTEEKMVINVFLIKNLN